MPRRVANFASLAGASTAAVGNVQHQFRRVGGLVTIAAIAHWRWRQSGCDSRQERLNRVRRTWLMTRLAAQIGV
jgi:hypothetical protein